MTPLEPDLQRLGDALHASTTIDLARAAPGAASGGRRRSADERAPRRARWSQRPWSARLGPRALAGSTLALAGVAAALLLTLGGTAAPAPALAVTRQPDGSVLVAVSTDVAGPWVRAADQKLAAMGLNEQVVVGFAPGPAVASGPMTCTPWSSAPPGGPPVKVLLDSDGTATIPSGNTGAGPTGPGGTVHLARCITFRSPGLGVAGNTGDGSR